MSLQLGNQLEENDDFLILSLDDVEISKKNIFLVDRKSGYFSIFSHNGKLINYYSPSLFLTHIVEDYYKDFQNENKLWFNENEIKVVNLNDYNKKYQINLSKKQFYSKINNKFGSLHKKNDSIIQIAAHVYYIAIPIDETIKYKYILNQTIILDFNIKSEAFKLFFINNKPLLKKIYDENISLRYYDIFSLNDSLYVTNSNDLFLLDTINKRYPIILNKIYNNKIEAKIELPELLTRSNINYFSNGFEGKMFNNELYYKFYFLPYIYKDKKVLFNIKPESLFYVNDNLKKYNPNLDLEILNNFNFTFNNIDIFNESIYCLIRTKNNFVNKELRNKYILQKYDLVGNLLNQKTFNPKIKDILEIKGDINNPNNVIIFYFENDKFHFKSIEI